MAITNNVKGINSKCQVVVFPWKYNTLSRNFSDKELSQASLLDISKYVLDASFSKTLSNAAGTFELNLANDRDWKEVLKPGTWCLIYMSQFGDLSIPEKDTDINSAQLKRQKNRLRGICYIERVTSKGRVGQERGEFSVVFSVSGRDFGVIYEETEIWHNLIKYETTLLKSASSQLKSLTDKRVHTLLDLVHRLFFSPADLVKVREDTGSLISTSLQWLLPKELINALGLGLNRGKSYYGNIKGLLNLETTKCTLPMEDPLLYLSGGAWSKLKALSIEPLHELFTETTEDGAPRLNFRPIPWILNSRNSGLRPLGNTVKKFRDVSRVQIPTIDIIDFDVGEDNHTRYSLFFTAIRTASLYGQDSISVLADSGFPKIQQASVKRHGLRLMYNEVNALIQFGTAKADPNLLKAYNELMFEYWNNAIFMESGSFTIVGNNEVKLGKVMQIEENAPYNSNKLFYIEGYTDSFSVGEERGETFWTQTITVTRGIEESGSLDKRDNLYNEFGKFIGDNK